MTRVAKSLGASETAGHLFLAIGVAADMVALGMPRSPPRRCWPAWYDAWKAKAVSALAVMGISAPLHGG